MSSMVRFTTPTGSEVSVTTSSTPAAWSLPEDPSRAVIWSQHAWQPPPARDRQRGWIRVTHGRCLVGCGYYAPRPNSPPWSIWRACYPPTEPCRADTASMTPDWCPPPASEADIDPDSIITTRCAGVPAEILSATSSLVVFPLAAAITRQVGISAQPRLYAVWGGPPPPHGCAGAVLSARMSSRVATARRVPCSGTHCLPPPVRTRDLQAAEDAYTEAIRRLRGKTRDKHWFALLCKEKLAYGFARILYGGKRLGQLIAGGTLLATAAAATAIGQLTIPVNAVPLLLPGIVSLLALGLWPLITEKTVRPPAEVYAERLMEALQTLATAHEV